MLQEKTAIERQKSELKREVASLQDSIECKNNKLSKLQRQINESAIEAKNLMKQIKEEQERNQSE